MDSQQQQTLSTDHIFEEAERLCLLASRDPSYQEAYEQAMTEVNKLEHNGWKKRTGMTQEQKVLKHLETVGSITVREAIMDYSIQSLTKRISNLREAGHNIISNRKTHAITGQEYVRYTLAS